MDCPQKNRVLVIDDEIPARELLRRYLEKLDFSVELAVDGLEGLAKLHLGIDLVLCDIRMPEIDGFEVIERIREKYSSDELPIIVVTGSDGMEERLRAVELGANDFIAKPLDKTELSTRVSAQFRLQKMHRQILEHEKNLERTVEERTAELTKALKNMTEARRILQRANLETIDKLARASEYKDNETGQHIVRVSRYTQVIARKLGLAPSEVRIVTTASVLHDVGKMGIPDAILLKPGKYTPEEFEIMKQHTIIGGKILDHSESELLQAGKTIALSHHEKWDGSGYPNGLSGEDVPLYGRICAVADVFDALVSERPYKDPMPFDDAVAYIQRESGSHFDPKVAAAFLAREESIRAIHDEGSAA